MTNKFSYYDFVANIVPAIFLWWGFNFVPFSSKVFDTHTTGAVEGTIVFIVLVYVLGLAIQHLAKHTIEPLLKKVFWHGTFFSNIYLVKCYGKIKEP